MLLNKLSLFQFRSVHIICLFDLKIKGITDWRSESLTSVFQSWKFEKAFRRNREPHRHSNGPPEKFCTKYSQHNTPCNMSPAICRSHTWIGVASYKRHRAAPAAYNRGNNKMWQTHSARLKLSRVSRMIRRTVKQIIVAWKSVNLLFYAQLI